MGNYLLDAINLLRNAPLACQIGKDKLPILCQVNNYPTMLKAAAVGVHFFLAYLTNWQEPHRPMLIWPKLCHISLKIFETSVDLNEIKSYRSS